MKKRLFSSLLHILIFVIIEIAFIMIILHEFPAVSFFEKIWIIHLFYWIAIFVAGYIRESMRSFQTRFLATYLPILIHVLGHLYIGHETLEIATQHTEHSNIWILVSTFVLWIFIFVGEYLLHNKYHCETHHESVHKSCKE